MLFTLDSAWKSSEYRLGSVQELRKQKENEEPAATCFTQQEDDKDWLLSSNASFFVNVPIVGIDFCMTRARTDTCKRVFPFLSQVKKYILPGRMRSLATTIHGKNLASVFFKTDSFSAFQTDGSATDDIWWLRKMDGRNSKTRGEIAGHGLSLPAVLVNL